LDREITEDGQTLEELLGNHGLEDTTLEYITLSDAIEKLSQRERVVIMLRFFRCMTQQQAARVMGISQVQVSRIERAALKKLREYM
ncbi:MAG: sigma-70 family RNA polymerase sigma factor, partial [Oscillospiraceae bacterium]|nr:sigma-70 family RNA polymerase sigma factor [Oscillospiraceae bacterium]